MTIDKKNTANITNFALDKNQKTKTHRHLCDLIYLPYLCVKINPQIIQPSNPKTQPTNPASRQPNSPIHQTPDPIGQNEEKKKRKPLHLQAFEPNMHSVSTNKNCEEFLPLLINRVCRNEIKYSSLLYAVPSTTAYCIYPQR